MARIEEEIKQTEFKNEYLKGFINLSFTYHKFVDYSKAHFKKFKVTSQQYNVLRILRGSYPNSKKVGDIKAVMIDKNPDLTRLLERLEKKSYVTRKLHDKDKRQVNVSITEQGLALLSEMDIRMEGWDDYLKTLSEEDMKTLNNLLDKWRG